MFYGFKKVTFNFMFEFVMECLYKIEIRKIRSVSICFTDFSVYFTINLQINATIQP